MALPHNGSNNVFCKLPSFISFIFSIGYSYFIG
jgi:hypothetical protein